MHCPSCGQQQISHETKFCSRCGMPLVLVTEVLNNGGYLPQLAELAKRKNSLINRRNGLGFGIIWLLFCLFLTAIGGGVFQNEDFGAVMAIMGVFGAAMIFLFSLIILRPEKKMARMDPATIAELSGTSPQAGLPAAPFQSAEQYVPRRTDWRSTSDLEPSSVTDSTTKLLDKEDRR